MDWLAKGKRGAGFVPLLLSLILVLVAAVLPVPMACAQGGIGMTGTFYAQVFRIPQGVEVSAPSIYVVVRNEGEEEAQFEMSYDAPSGVEILLSETGFTLSSGGQKKVLITVRVSEDAVPGQYELVVRAEQVVAQVEGQVAIATAASQKADLTIVGEAARVDVRAVSPDGAPVVCQVRLFRGAEGRGSEFASSETGVLEAKVSPGSYVASAYVDGKKLAEESFDVAADESKDIALTVRTVYIGGFGAIPNYFTETGKLAHVEVVYAINNLYQNMADVEIILKVSLDGEPVEEISLITLGSLNTGRTGGRYNYVPAKGWESGEYGFEIELYAGDKLYTRTLVQKLTVELPSPVNYVQVGGIVAAIVIVAGAVYYAARKRKKRSSELA